MLEGYIDPLTPFFSFFFRDAPLFQILPPLRLSIMSPTARVFAAVQALHEARPASQTEHRGGKLPIGIHVSINDGAAQQYRLYGILLARLARAFLGPCSEPPRPRDDVSHRVVTAHGTRVFGAAVSRGNCGGECGPVRCSCGGVMCNF